ncbi:MAG: hypothetical protein V4650_13220 [Pseudomonadota bacterium]
MSKTLQLLGKSIPLTETRGVVLDVQISKETKVTGGGGSGTIHNGTGYIQNNRISSFTTTTTKLYLKAGTREVAFSLPGEFELRSGHDVTVIEGQGSYFALLNHSLDKKYWGQGAGFASRAGLATKPKYSLLRHFAHVIGGMLTLAILVAKGCSSEGRELFGLAAIFIGIPAGFVSYFLWRDIRTKQTERLATQEVDAFVKQNY